MPSLNKWLQANGKHVAWRLDTVGSTRITLHRSKRLRLIIRLAVGCSALAVLAACSSSGQRQSYAGEDTAYYLAHAKGGYTPPGPPSDPWGPYIQIASAHFDVPQMWIRQVMRVESGGHEYSNGQLIVSDAGAMGLMQLEPGTYQEMAARYGLGNDPFNPLDNIMAGAAYIHEMYQIYGCPGFLAAYNAGPGRLDSYIHYDRPLPLQTTNYVAMIAPNIEGYYPIHRSPADETALNTEPMGEDGGLLPSGFTPEAPTAGELSAPVQIASLAPPPASYSAPAPVTVPTSSIMPQAARIETANASLIAPSQIASPPPVRMAFNSSTHFTPHIMNSAPVERVSYTPAARVAPPPIPRPPYGNSGLPFVNSAMASTPANAGFNSGLRSWGIQVGAYDNASNAKAALGMAKLSGAHSLQNAEAIVARVDVNGGVVYRARFVGLQRMEAVNACNRLSGGPTGCVVLSPNDS